MSFVACAKRPGPSDNAMRTSLSNRESETDQTADCSQRLNHRSFLSTWSIPLAGKGHEQSTTQPCRPTRLKSMEGRSQRHKDLPHLLAHPRVRHLRSSWHAVDRELEGYPVMRTPFRKKICASGAYGGETFIFTVE